VTDSSALSGLKTGFWKRRETGHPRDLKDFMLSALALILIIAWLLGLVSGYTMGGFIHILLAVAIVIILVRLIQGKKSSQ
jgi:uncharacterized membrane protein